MRHGRRALVISLAAGVATATIGACSDSSPETPRGEPHDAAVEADVGSDEASPADASTCGLPGSFGSKKCSECVATACCAELAACEGNAPCNALLACVLTCIQGPDAGGCSSECFARHSAGTEAYRTLERCWFFTDPCKFHCAVGP